MTYEGMLAKTIAFRGHNGDVGEANCARPLGAGPWPGVVLIQHMPGWDEWIKEATRKRAHHGFATVAPHLYFRDGPGSPDDVGAQVRAAGGVSDAQSDRRHRRRDGIPARARQGHAPAHAGAPAAAEYAGKSQQDKSK
jgi:dienelactone hydrolase